DLNDADPQHNHNGQQEQHARSRYVRWLDIKTAVRGRETDVLDRLNIPWRRGNPHINCPYPEHPDKTPSWRWDVDGARAFCSCGSDSIFKVIEKIENIDFEAAKIRAAELIGREDLIIDPLRLYARHIFD